MKIDTWYLGTRANKKHHLYVEKITFFRAGETLIRAVHLCELFLTTRPK